MKFSSWLQKYYDSPDRRRKDESGSYYGIRLGQRFCNEYIKQSWAELYYMEDEEKAVEIIVDWLVKMHYYPHMSHKLGETL